MGVTKVRLVGDCSARPAGFVLLFPVSVPPRLFAEPPTKRKQRTFAGMTQTGEVVDGFASVFRRFLCVCVCVAAAGCCGLAQKGSPDVGEKCKVSCRWKKRKELEDKPNKVYLRLQLFFFSILVFAKKGHTKQHCQSVACFTAFTGRVWVYCGWK